MAEKAKKNNVVKMPAKKTPAAKKAAGGKEKDVEEVNEDKNGPRLPGMPIKVVKALVDFANKHEDTKDQHRKYTDKLIAEDEEAEMLFQKYKEHFTEDGDGGHFYRAAGIEIIRPKEKHPKIKTKHTDDI